MNPALLAPLLMIASGSIHAVVNAIVKGGRDKMAGRALTDGSSALLMLPALVFVPWPTGAWWYFAGTAVAHAIYLYALIRAYEVSDLSASYPVLRGTAPLVTALVTLGILGEHASTADIAGIALIGGSMFALVLGRHLGRAGLGWSLLTGVSIAGYTVIDAMGVRAAPTPFSYIAWVFVIMGAFTVLMFSTVSKGAMFASARAQWRPGVIAGCLSIVTLRHGALRDVDRPDRAAGGIARDRDGHRADHRDRVPEGARDAGARGRGARYPWRGGVDLGGLGRLRGKRPPPSPHPNAGEA